MSGGAALLTQLGWDGAVLATLAAAHMLGDFVLQTAALARRKARWRWMILHCGVHAVLSAIALLAVASPGPALFGTATSIAIAHCLIDRLKVALDARAHRPIGHFALDQSLHAAILFVAWMAFASGASPAGHADPVTLEWVTKVGVVVAAYAFNTAGAGIVVGGILRRHRLESAGLATPDSASPLAARGRTIGILERMLLLTLILVGQWGAMGFVLAAKSIARFKDLDRREFSEYYLIGTLASTGIAMASGLLVRLLL